MQDGKLTIGSRGSQLALWQAEWVQARLEALGITAEIRTYKTTGDKITDVPLSRIGTKALFTKELEEALLAGEIDLAVHSLKDMPAELPARLTIAAVPEREDPRDALLGCTLAELPEGGVVGTTSLRRAAQLLRLRPDLQIETLRGNLDTRIRKLHEHRFDAIVLAAAGLRRLGWEAEISELLPPDVMCPAVGQGALALESLEQGSGAEACKLLEHAPTRAAITAERALLRALGGGCTVPIGAHATLDGSRLQLRAVVLSPDGREGLLRTAEGDAAAPAEVGRSLAEEMLAAGARRILEASDV